MLVVAFYMLVGWFFCCILFGALILYLCYRYDIRININSSKPKKEEKK